MKNYRFYPFLVFKIGKYFKILYFNCPSLEEVKIKKQTIDKLMGEFKI